MPLYNLERSMRTPMSESWRVIERDKRDREVEMVAEIEAHFTVESTNKTVGDYGDMVVLGVVGTIILYTKPTEEWIRELRRIADGLFTCCFDRDFTICTGKEIAYITNEKQESGPTEIRIKKGARNVTLPEPE